jgi:hypothetical protein
MFEGTDSVCNKVDEANRLATSCSNKHRRDPPPPRKKYLRSGKNQCDIRAKHKSFGKMLICSEKFFVSLRKLRDVRENVLIMPAKFSYVCGNLVKKY